MAIVTIELRNLLRTSNFDLWDFDLGIDDPLFESRLKETIENYFYFNEIGSETPDRFKHRFQSRLKLILPYYNDLYNTTLLDFDPLINYRMEEIFEGDDLEGVIANITGQSDSTSGNKISGSETSQNDLTETEYPQHSQITSDIPSGKTQNKGTGSNTQNTDGTYSENTSSKTDQNKKLNKNYNKTVEGITGRSYISLIKEYRDNIINIEKMILNDLKDLFILIY